MASTGIAALLDPRVVATVFRTFGWAGAIRRARHEFRVRANRFRADPPVEREPGGEPGPAFALALARIAATTDQPVGRARADRVLAGEHQAYRWEWRRLPKGAEWSRHPGTGRSIDSAAPWWRLDLLDPAVGDIKDLWEPGRFGWVFDLIRGYALSGDDRYPAACFERLGDWMQANRPYRGAQWACGQEAAIRAVALLYAEAAFAGTGPGTSGGAELLRTALWWSGWRIADAIDYALAQRNNHGLSEAVGLLAIGSRFRRHSPVADEWFRRGRALVEGLVREQFAGDGWYIQHSFTYARLAVDQCVIAERVLRAEGLGLSAGATERLAAAGALFDRVIDPASGIVPNHGANDGAFVHPITVAGYRDFRPTITAIAACWGGAVADDLAIDSEVLAWLGRQAPAREPARRDGVWSGPSGWAVGRRGGTSVFLRAGRYTSRPGHVDPLHVDVRLGGREVIVDPGTYSYNGGPHWRNALADPEVHNGPLVDGVRPGVRGPRFLWYRWPESRVVTARIDRSPELTAEVPGRVRREISFTDRTVTIRDRVLAPDWRSAKATWLLHPEASPAMVRGYDRVEAAGSAGPAGWYSPHYGQRIASAALVVERAGGTDPLQQIVIGANDETVP